MNKVSEHIIMRCKTNLRTTGCSCEADAAAVERLVQAAEAAHETLLAMIDKDIRPMGIASELNAALAAFREVSNEPSQ